MGILEEKLESLLNEYAALWLTIGSTRNVGPNDPGESRKYKEEILDLFYEVRDGRCGDCGVLFEHEPSKFIRVCGWCVSENNLDPGEWNGA